MRCTASSTACAPSSSRSGVDVMIVCPSFVATRIDRNALGGDGQPVRHAQVTVGRPLTAEAAAAELLAGAGAGKRLLLIGATARQAWHLSRIAPTLYERIMARRLRAELESDQGPADQKPDRERYMKVHVKHTLKTDVASAFKLCTDQKHQETIYAQLGGSNVKIKREGRAPNVKLAISRTEDANPPAAIRKLVPSESTVSHTEDWSADGDLHQADIVIDIKGVPVKISGTKSLRPDKKDCIVEWRFDVTCGIPLLGGVIASFVGSEMEQKLESEFKILKSMA